MLAQLAKDFYNMQTAMWITVKFDYAFIGSGQGGESAAGC